MGDMAYEEARFIIEPCAEGLFRNVGSTHAVTGSWGEQDEALRVAYRATALSVLKTLKAFDRDMLEAFLDRDLGYLGNLNLRDTPGSPPCPCAMCHVPS